MGTLSHPDMSRAGKDLCYAGTCTWDVQCEHDDPNWDAVAKPALSRTVPTPPRPYMLRDNMKLVMEIAGLKWQDATNIRLADGGLLHVDDVAELFRCGATYVSLDVQLPSALDVRVQPYMTSVVRYRLVPIGGEVIG